MVLSYPQSLSLTHNNLRAHTDLFLFRSRQLKEGAPPQVETPYLPQADPLPLFP